MFIYWQKKTDMSSISKSKWKQMKNQVISSHKCFWESPLLTLAVMSAVISNDICSLYIKKNKKKKNNMQFQVTNNNI